MLNKINKVQGEIMNTQNLLVEIGTEELPPKSLKTLAQAFAVIVK